MDQWKKTRKCNGDADLRSRGAPVKSPDTAALLLLSAETRGKRCMRSSPIFKTKN